MTWKRGEHNGNSPFEDSRAQGKREPPEGGTAQGGRGRQNNEVPPLGLTNQAAKEAAGGRRERERGRKEEAAGKDHAHGMTTAGANDEEDTSSKDAEDAANRRYADPPTLVSSAPGMQGQHLGVGVKSVRGP